MRRIKLLKDTKYGKKDAVVHVDNNEAFGLIDSGQAIITKDMNESDEEQADVKHTQLRTHKSK